jgi:hypothetical protein
MSSYILEIENPANAASLFREPVDNVTGLIPGVSSPALNVAPALSVTPASFDFFGLPSDFFPAFTFARLAFSLEEKLK